jgi:hypothetical protein
MKKEATGYRDWFATREFTVAVPRKVEKRGGKTAVDSARFSKDFLKGTFRSGDIFIRNKQKPLARSFRDVTLMKIVASAFERSYRRRALARLSAQLSSASLITQSTYAGIIRGFVPAVC